MVGEQAMMAALGFKMISGLLALLALISGGVAARCSYQATAVSNFPAWTPPGFPGRLEPVDPASRQDDLNLASYEGAQKTGDLNRTAVRWTIAAVILSTAASVAGLFPLWN